MSSKNAQPAPMLKKKTIDQATSVDLESGDDDRREDVYVVQVDQTPKPFDLEEQAPSQTNIKLQEVQPSSHDFYPQSQQEML